MMKRTASVTAASIAGVILAGGTAIGANVGILQAADSSPLGQLSAEVSAPTTTTLGEALEADPTGSAGSASATQASLPEVERPSIQSFAIDTAGTIDLEAVAGTLLIDRVTTNPGWSWVPGSASPDSVTITFTSGGDVLEFSAFLHDDGMISANVDQPITIQATPAQPAAPTTGGSHDDHDDGDHDDGDHDDGDHNDDHNDDDHDDHDDHEGRNDDD